eukprot:CAMPEP_0179379424 /NCGR_PEP_ID=MMETSP0797-20121207/89832_1 /TAXON_ID=47934 /ORGANISM="Dinophysis acuminata, Strain DAEP01" /LENGTH=557 /DNA_ID=CAMNT_0021095503 /DNA_START=23 /DNA_END=1693 /DNA_ORIENTATION=+
MPQPLSNRAVMFLGTWHHEEQDVVLRVALGTDNCIRAVYRNNSTLLEQTADGFEGTDVITNGRSLGRRLLLRIASDHTKLILQYQKSSTGGWLAPACLRRVSYEEQMCSGRYTSMDSIWEALYTGDALLIKGTWLFEWTRAGRLLPRRQELPPGAAWEPKELAAAARRGAGGQDSGAVLLLEGQEAPGPGRRDTALAGHARLAAPLRTVSQRDPAAERRRNLHRLVLHVPGGQEREGGGGVQPLPEGHRPLVRPPGDRVVAADDTHPDMVPYGERGWPVFEGALSSMVKPQHMILDLANFSKDVCLDWRMTHEACQTSRLAPLVPQTFAKILLSKSFSNWRDYEKVEPKYASTFHSLMSSAEVLNFASAGWRDNEAEILAMALKHCPVLKTLLLDSNKIAAPGAAALAAMLPHCEALEVLQLRQNPLGDVGVAAIAAVLPRCMKLRKLGLTGTYLGDAGAQALAHSLPRCHALETLLIDQNQIKDSGAAVLESMLPLCQSLVRVQINGNQLSDKAKDSLMEAWRRCGSTPAPSRSPPTIHPVQEVAHYAMADAGHKP